MRLEGYGGLGFSTILQDILSHFIRKSRRKNSDSQVEQFNL